MPAEPTPARRSQLDLERIAAFTPEIEIEPERLDAGLAELVQQMARLETPELARAFMLAHRAHQMQGRVAEHTTGAHGAQADALLSMAHWGQTSQPLIVAARFRRFLWRTDWVDSVEVWAKGDCWRAISIVKGLRARQTLDTYPHDFPLTRVLQLAGYEVYPGSRSGLSRWGWATLLLSPVDHALHILGGRSTARLGIWTKEGLDRELRQGKVKREHKDTKLLERLQGCALWGYCKLAAWAAAAFVGAVLVISWWV